MEFVHLFHRCITYFRFREVGENFQSQYGDVVLQTSLRSLERSVLKQFTKEIFVMFRITLRKATLSRVIDCQEMSMYSIFSVSKYQGAGKVWQVTYCPSPVGFRCSWLRMESIGLPCHHIVSVMVHLG